MLKELTSTEERLRRREKALADRAEALRQQAQEADRLTRKKKEPQDRPGSKLDEAMRRGDLQAAADELNRLSRQLEQKDLTDEQCRDFDARLILLLVNHIGDEAAIREALKEAAAQ